MWQVAACISHNLYNKLKCLSVFVQICGDGQYTLYVDVVVLAFRIRWIDT